MQNEPVDQRSRLPAVRATSVVGLAGILAALLGGWMLIGPSDGRLTIAIPGLFEQSWNAAELVEAWAAPLLLLGGGLAAGAFSWIAWTIRSAGRPAIELVGLTLAAIGLLAALIGTSRLI